MTREVAGWLSVYCSIHAIESYVLLHTYATSYNFTTTQSNRRYCLSYERLQIKVCTQTSSLYRNQTKSNQERSLNVSAINSNTWNRPKPPHNHTMRTKYITAVYNLTPTPPVLSAHRMTAVSQLLKTAWIHSDDGWSHCCSPTSMVSILLTELELGQTSAIRANMSETQKMSERAPTLARAETADRNPPLYLTHVRNDFQGREAYNEKTERPRYSGAAVRWRAELSLRETDVCVLRPEPSVCRRVSWRPL